MEVFGSSFDDDLFESEKSTVQSNVKLHSSWTPNLCEPKVKTMICFLVLYVSSIYKKQFLNHSGLQQMT